MKIKRSVILIASALLILALLIMPFTSCSSKTTTSEKPEAKTLRIGHLAALTEWFSFYDILQERETQAVAQIINENGGVTVGNQKYIIEIITEDFKSTLDGVAAAANKLIAEDVDFVVGPMGFFSVASTPILEKEGMLHVCSWCTCQPGEMDETTPYSFLGHNNCLGDFVGTLDALKQIYPEVKNLAIIMPDDGQIPYLTPIIERLVGDAGYTIVGEPVGYPNEMTEFSPIGAKLNSYKGVDAYVQMNGAGTHTGNIVKSLRELGNYTLYCQAGPTSCNDVLTIAGETFGTNVMTGGYEPGDAANPPIVNQIYSILEPKYGFNTMNLMNANSLYVLVEAIEAAQSLDPDVVKSTWESMNTIDTIFGKGNMGGEEIYGIRHAVTHPHSIHRLMDGKVFLEGWIDVGPLP